MDEYKEVLRFWFGELSSPTDTPKNKRDLWFRNGQAYDEQIRQQFGQLHQSAIAGDLDHWAESPRGCLALIILLDQFSRHIFRNTAAAFAQDAQAQSVVREALKNDFDRELYFFERVFFYIPLEHAEDIDLQNESVALYQSLYDEAPKELKSTFATFLSFAQSHRTVIEKFGRFPELNKILERESTPEEIEFLATGKYQFL